ncbi:hypothetical protein Q7P36_003870 [Cladosporium allicinum]
MASKPQTNGAPKMNGMATKKAAPSRAPVKRATPNASRPAQKARPVQNKAASVAGGDSSYANGVGGAYAIMASRIANRVAEMAESITFVERQKPQMQQQMQDIAESGKKAPRKLEMRLPPGGGNGQSSVAFSAPFLDNTLQKMLQLQNRMLTTTAQLSKSEGVEESVIKEHAAQSAELSRIIAMICAEKARQGA